MMMNVLNFQPLSICFKLILILFYFSFYSLTTKKTLLKKHIITKQNDKNEYKTFILF